VEHNDILTLRDAGWIITMTETAIAGVDFDRRHFYETIQNAIEGRYKELEFVV
jgi:hypothetical protein